MAPRAFGALLALVAALLFATSLAGGLAPKLVPGWWDGHPIVEGKARELKVIHVGLLEASGCNLGEQVKCEPLDMNDRLLPVSYGELGALGAGGLTLLVLALSVGRVGARRRALAKLALFEIAVIGGGAAAIFFLRGPDLNVQMRLGLPANLGLFSAIGGCVTGALAAALALRVERPPLRSRSAAPRRGTPQPPPAMPPAPPHSPQEEPPPAPRPAPPPAFDVHELLHDHRQITPRSSEKAGPNQPLFETAPQLRPLYDLLPPGPPPSPAELAPATRTPTPVPPEQARPLPGVSASSPVEAVPPVTSRAAYDDRGDAAAAHVPVAFGAEPYIPFPRASPPPAPGSQAPETLDELPFDADPRSIQHPARPSTKVRKAAAAVGGPVRAARPVAPKLGGAHRPTISAPVPPMPQPEPIESSTSVDIDAVAGARVRGAGEWSAHAPESFEEVETRDAHGLDEDELASARTELAPFRHPPPRAASELPTQPSPNLDTELATERDDHRPAMNAAVRARSEAPARAERVAVPPAQDQALERDDAVAPPPPPANRPAISPERPPASAAGTESPTDLAAPPPPPGPPPSAASIQSAPSSPGPLPGATAAASPANPAPTASTPPRPPPARQRRISGAPPPTNAAAVPLASFAVAPSAASPVAGGRAVKPTEPPPPLRPKSASIAPAPRPSAAASPASPPAATPPPAPRPSAAASPASPPTATPPPAVAAPAVPGPLIAAPVGTASPPGAVPLGTASPVAASPATAPLVTPPIVTAPPVTTPIVASPPGAPPLVAASGVTAPLVAPPPGALPVIAPSISAPPIASVPKGPLPSLAKPVVTVPRTLKPSVPPPAAKPSGPLPKTAFEAKAAPFMPSNLAAAASANKATTASTPAPFATIPSPFTKPAPPAPTLPSTGGNEAPSRSVDVVDEAPTVPSPSRPEAQPGDAPAPPPPAPSSVAPLPSTASSSPRASDPALSTGANVPISTAPTSLPPPKQAPQAASGPMPACPQCEAPMAWVEEHLRFYCASCRMYF